MKNIKFFPCFLFIISLFLCFFCQADAGQKDIESLLKIPRSKLIERERSLSANNLLDYFRIREEVASVSYADLLVFKDRVNQENCLPKFSGLIEIILEKKEKEGAYLLGEEMAINNLPMLRDFPFYAGWRSEYNIRQLCPYAESLYFNNPKFEYHNNDLIRKTELLWVNRNNIEKDNSSLPDLPVPSANFLPFDNIRGSAAESWSYRLPGDNLSDYLISARQWIKEYQESEIFPVISGDFLIMRNNSSVFCVDALSGRELWLFKDPYDSGRSFYRTFNRPHLNTHGYQFLLAGNVIFTELGESLVALKLNGSYIPALLWGKHLGEYALCTKPIAVNDLIITGLINARGELWISGFNCKNGILAWRTYIGTCSFLSPPCQLVLIKDGQILLGTNHGVLISLRPSDGKVLWAHKYKPRNYSLIDYGNTYFLNKDLIVYDTQFLDADDQKVYYKPRESEYLYILDLATGWLKKSIFIDTDNYRILQVKNDRGIFLKGAVGKNKNAEFQIVDLNSGEPVYSYNIEMGNLKGVFPLGEGQLVCKIDNNVYFLKLTGDKIKLKKTRLASKESWLVGGSPRYIFTGDKGVMTCSEVLDKNILPQINSVGTIYLQGLQRMRENLKIALQSDSVGQEGMELRRRLSKDFNLCGSPAPLKEFFNMIADHHDKLREPGWNEFVSVLQERYANQIVTYRGIEILFQNFLIGSGIVGPGIVPESAKPNPAGQNNVKKGSGFKARGDRIYPLPVKVLDGGALPEFFLLLNRDQLLCADERGKILWARKVYYRNYPSANSFIKYDTDENVGRMFGDDIQAYLYRGVLIINDRVNVIAVESGTGKYLWSMTNKKEAFEEGREFPPLRMDGLYQRYGFDRAFLKNIMFYTEFLDGRLIVLNGNKIYSVDPLTGFCRKYSTLKMEGAIRMSVAAGKIYIVSHLLDSLKVLDSNFVVLKEISLSFIKDKNCPPDLLFINNNILLHCGTSLYILDPESGRFSGEVFADVPVLHRIEVFEDKLLVIVPFKKITCYNLEKGALKVVWNFNVESADEAVAWIMRERKTNYYFIIDHNILLLSRRNEEFFFVNIDINTGKEVWEKKLPGIKGLFYDLSSSKKYQDKINFIITTGCEGIIDQMESFPDVSSIFVNSKLCALDFLNGQVSRKDNIASFSQNRWVNKSDLVETRNRYIYIVDCKILVVEDKSQ